MKIRTKVLSVFLSLMLVLSFTSFASFGETNPVADMEVSIIDVGQGDSILIQSEGETMLVDAGSSDGGTPIPYLASQDFGQIEYLVATHPDSDHINKIEAVLDKYQVENIYYTYGSSTSDTYSTFISAMKREGCSYSHPTSGQTWTLGDAIVEVITDGQEGKTVNDQSIVLKVTCGGKSVLLMGDASTTIESELVEENADINSDVLKVGHHGSKYSSSSEFLTEVTPAYGAISCGAGNSYGHPDSETLTRLSNAGCTVSRTDLSGTIEYDFTAGKVVCTTEKSGLSNVTGFAVSSGSKSAITLKWGKTANASGYQIQKYISSNWKTIKIITSNSVVTYKTTSDILTGNNKYRIRAYKNGTAKTYSSYTNCTVYVPGKVTLKSTTTPMYCYITKTGEKYHLRKSCVQNPIKTTIAKAKKAGYEPCKKCGSPYVTVKWSKMSSASGYAIYKKIKGGSYKIIKTISSNSTICYKDQSVKSEKTYYYYVKAYKKNGSAKVYGSSSAVKYTAVK